MWISPPRGSRSVTVLDALGVFTGTREGMDWRRGRGFEPSVEVYPGQLLSRQPCSTTPAPLRVSEPDILRRGERFSIAWGCAAGRFHYRPPRTDRRAGRRRSERRRVGRPRSRSPACLRARQHRAAGVLHHPLRGAAQEQVRQPGAAVGAHGDEIGAGALRLVDDDLRRVALDGAGLDRETALRRAPLAISASRSCGRALDIAACSRSTSGSCRRRCTRKAGGRR